MLLERRSPKRSSLQQNAAPCHPWPGHAMGRMTNSIIALAMLSGIVLNPPSTILTFDLWPGAGLRDHYRHSGRHGFNDAHPEAFHVGTGDKQIGVGEQSQLIRTIQVRRSRSPHLRSRQTEEQLRRDGLRSSGPASTSLNLRHNRLYFGEGQGQEVKSLNRSECVPSTRQWDSLRRSHTACEIGHGTAKDLREYPRHSAVPELCALSPNLPNLVSLLCRGHMKESWLGAECETR